MKEIYFTLLILSIITYGAFASTTTTSTGQTTTTTWGWWPTPEPGTTTTTWGWWPTFVPWPTLTPIPAPTPVPTPTMAPTGGPGDLDITIDSGTPGTVKITGSSKNGIPGSTNLIPLRITFHAISAGSDPGQAYFGLSVDDLRDIYGNTIGINHSALGFTVKIYSGTTTSVPATTTIFPLTTTSLPPGAGNAWLTPPGCTGIGYCIEYYGGMSVRVGANFSLDLHMNTGDTNLGEFEFTITYPETMISFVSVETLP
ncbi:MAG: hypothetical protein JXB88_10050 [Spirochaetales bacterium]|nr:hypothetical protein [Spirochaetales bacterium]